MVSRAARNALSSSPLERRIDLHASQEGRPQLSINGVRVAVRGTCGCGIGLYTPSEAASGLCCDCASACNPFATKAVRP